MWSFCLEVHFPIKVVSNDSIKLAFLVIFLMYFASSSMLYISEYHILFSQFIRYLNQSKMLINVLKQSLTLWNIDTQNHCSVVFTDSGFRPVFLPLYERIMETVYLLALGNTTSCETKTSYLSRLIVQCDLL